MGRPTKKNRAINAWKRVYSSIKEMKDLDLCKIYDLIQRIEAVHGKEYRPLDLDDEIFSLIVPKYLADDSVGYRNKLINDTAKLLDPWYARRLQNISRRRTWK